MLIYKAKERICIICCVFIMHCSYCFRNILRNHRHVLLVMMTNRNSSYGKYWHCTSLPVGILLSTLFKLSPRARIVCSKHSHWGNVYLIIRFIVLRVHVHVSILHSLLVVCDNDGKLALCMYSRLFLGSTETNIHGGNIGPFGSIKTDYVGISITCL